jgi:FkbM family methyltransferase
MHIYERIHMLHRVWRYRLREEKESIHYMLKQNLKGKTVLDIGANRGIYTYWMAKAVGSKGKVISFEPQPELGDFLNDMINSFRFHNVDIVNKGLSEKKGKTLMVRSKVGSGGAHFSAEEEDLSAYTDQNRFSVEVTTLDNYYTDNSIPPLAFVKCDVENHELQVFKGGKQTLSKYKPDLLFECHHHEAASGTIFNYLKNLGYNGFFIYKGKQVSVDDFAAYPYKRATNTHRNYIFVAKK